MPIVFVEISLKLVGALRQIMAPLLVGLLDSVELPLKLARALRLMTLVGLFVVLDPKPVEIPLKLVRALRQSWVASPAIGARPFKVEIPLKLVRALRRFLLVFLQEGLGVGQGVEIRLKLVRALRQPAIAD